MKTVSAICLLFITFVAISVEDLLELNGENLTQLALKNSSAEKLNQYALFLAKTENSTEYYKVRKDSKKLQKLIARKHKELMTTLAKVPRKSYFKLAQEISYESYDQDSALLSIRNFLLGSTKYISRKDHPDDGLPDHFFLLFANLEILKDIKVGKNKFKELLERRNLKKKPLSKKLYLEATIALPKYQNEDNFQTVIKHLNIYESKAKKNLLVSKQENKNTNNIINNWFLADGITSQLIGIHAFSFFGYRLQDIMGDPIILQPFCKKTIRIGLHQTIVCNKPYTKNSTLVITYIGGVVAQLDLIATGKLSLEEKKRISKILMKQLNKPKTLFQKSSEKWSKYAVNFEFYSDAFFDRTSKESQYHFSFGKSNEPVVSGKTLIVSMISEATKKLIEEHK